MRKVLQSSLLLNTAKVSSTYQKYRRVARQGSCNFITEYSHLEGGKRACRLPRIGIVFGTLDKKKV